jgi:asparagine synthase (glutamine-hydrolysing)
MCGICGVVQVGRDPRQVLGLDALDRMTDAMTHRGPDERGTHVEPGVALGIRRLSVVDVEAGQQPFATEDRSIWAVQNGELYNHNEIRRDLQRRGHQFRSRCDTEIIPHLYEEHGTAFPGRLRGMFGIAVWDRNRRRTMVVRDRLGIKPMYYASVGDLIVFASELKSVLASGLVAPELDFEAIEAYLTLGFVPGALTPLRGVKKLLPGELFVVDENGFRLERYWHYPKPEPDYRTSEEELAEQLLELLDESVRLRLMADVPLGAMLSGGLDSSLIVAMMARHTSEPVKTFSVGFREDAESSELGDAAFVSNVFGTDHHPLELSYTEHPVDLAELVWSLDEPIADLSALGFQAISELAAKHVTVALAGQGADELLGGYRKHRAASLVAGWQRLPGGVRRGGERALSASPFGHRRAGRALLAADPVERLLAMSARLDNELRGDLYRGPLGSADGLAARRAIEPLASGLDGHPLGETLHIDGQLALPDLMLHYFDRTSMKHSLEVRVPFLDHHVVEFCARIPDSLKVRRLQTKYLLKRAARGIVPDRIIDKRKLGFFRHSVDGWLKAQMEGSIADYLLDPDARYSEFLDRSTVERLLRDHRDGRPVDVHLLVAVLMLEIWLSSYLPRAIESGSPEAIPQVA